VKYLVIGSAAVLIALIIATTIAVLQARKLRAGLGHTGWDSVKARRMLDSAALILRNAGAARTIEDSDVLSHRTMKARDLWLENYNRLINKETNA
jgi:hypothetical protein